MKRVLVAVAVLACGGQTARRRLTVVTVSGASMEPALHDGDRLLVRRCRPDSLRRGVVAVFASPHAPVAVGASELRRHVKRVDALPGDPVPADVPVPAGTRIVPAGRVVVRADNPIGTDSRHWGPYDAAGLLGVLVCRTRTVVP